MKSGAGLELKREFLYVQVNDGQGIYTWIDYNGDGVKDLNEFEVAQFVDQASYIRVFTPSNEYVKTFSNEFNQGIFFKPEKLWANKGKFLKFMGRFSDQARVRINRKTNSFNSNEVLNPFYGQVRDTTLLSSSSTMRNTLYFNRTSSIFGFGLCVPEHAEQIAARQRVRRAHAGIPRREFRLNIRKKFSIETSYQVGTKIVSADYNGRAAIMTSPTGS